MEFLFVFALVFVVWVLLEKFKPHWLDKVKKHLFFWK